MGQSNCAVCGNPNKTSSVYCSPKCNVWGDQTVILIIPLDKLAEKSHKLAEDNKKRFDK